MEVGNDVKIIGMLGEMNNKIADMGLTLKNIQERSDKNFTFLAENQISLVNKLEKMEKDIEEIKFRTGVVEAGVSLNSSKLSE